MLPRLRNNPYFPSWADDFSFILDVAAPGMEKKDFILGLNPNVLTISAEKEEEKEEKTPKQITIK